MTKRSVSANIGLISGVRNAVALLEHIVLVAMQLLTLSTYEEMGLAGLVILVPE
jgi:hypothetical protein